MFSPTSRVLAVALAAVLLPAASATAQKVSLSPTIGVYFPTSELIKAANGDEFKQEVGLAVGGRLGFLTSSSTWRPVSRSRTRRTCSSARPGPPSSCCR